MPNVRQAVPASDVRAIAMALRAAVWSLRRFGERQLRLEPLPQSEFEVIRTVAGHSGITVSDVARQLGLQPSNVSSTVGRMVERGLIDRATDTHDRRSVRLRLTAKAARRHRMIEAVWVDGVRDQLEGMSDEEAELLVKAAPLFARLASME